LPAWKELMSASRRAKCQAEVRRSVLWSLNQGRFPDLTANHSTQPSRPSGARRRAKAETPAVFTSDQAPAWPLPSLPEEFAVPQRVLERWQVLAFLIDLAIDERRVDDIIHYYEAWQASQNRTSGREPYYSAGDRTAQVAAALAEVRPEYALQLRLKLLDRALQPTGEAAYMQVLSELKAIKLLLARLQRPQEFIALVERIRTEHRRRRNLVEHLNRMLSPRIIDSD
jgi:hypothetical protein